MEETIERAEKEGARAEIAAIYRETCKEHDIVWNRYVARPAASVVLYGLRRTSLTPNQVTFLGAFLFFVGVPAAMLAVPDWRGMVLAALVLEASYLLDCADGQLARLTGMTSDVGAYLDFLVDEFKALILVAACSVRVWMETGAWSGGEPVWLLVAVGGVMLVATATSLTTFVRREAYAGSEIEPGASARRAEIPDGFAAKIRWSFERLASLAIHYPSWFVAVALLDLAPGIDGARWFLYVFLGAYLLYTGKTGLEVVYELGRSGYYDDASFDDAIESESDERE